MSSVTGSCMCGLVSYTMSAEPLLSAICHCRDCQKQTGTSFSLVLGIPRDSFKITGDLSTYETIGMSGSKVKRNSAVIVDRLCILMLMHLKDFYL